MFHCADCSARLTGDTGYYRHRDPCRSFMEAQPDLPPRPGRTHGKAYPRELYEAVVGEVLSEVNLNAKLLTAVVSEVAPARQGPDRVALARVARQRDAATAKYIHDRDVAALVTDAAIAHGLGAVLPERFGISVNGRGESASPSLTKQSLRFVMINRTPRESFQAAAARSA